MQVSHLQVSHLQETVRQNDTVVFYIESAAVDCPPESEAARHLEQTRQHVAATDNVVIQQKTKHLNPKLISPPD